MNTIKVFQLKFVLRLLVGVSLFYPTLSYAPDEDVLDPMSVEALSYSSVKPVKSKVESDPKSPSQQISVVPAAAPAVAPKASDKLNRLLEDTIDEYHGQKVQFEENYKFRIKRK